MWKSMNNYWRDKMNVKEKIKEIEEILGIRESEHYRTYKGIYTDVVSGCPISLVDFLRDWTFRQDVAVQRLESTVTKLNKKIELFEKYLEIEMKKIPSKTKYAKLKKRK